MSSTVSQHPIIPSIIVPSFFSQIYCSMTRKQLYPKHLLKTQVRSVALVATFPLYKDMSEKYLPYLESSMVGGALSGATASALSYNPLTRRSFKLTMYGASYFYFYSLILGTNSKPVTPKSFFIDTTIGGLIGGVSQIFTSKLLLQRIKPTAITHRMIGGALLSITLQILRQPSEAKS